MDSYNDFRTGPKWSKVEDEELDHLIQIYGMNNWDIISSQLSSSSKRTPLMCKNRWKQMAENRASKGFWTEEEDEIIRQCIKNVIYLNIIL
jgi:hypothetical protein